MARDRRVSVIDWNIIVANVLTAIPPTIAAIAAWVAAMKASKNSEKASNFSEKASFHTLETKEQLAKTDVSINGRVDDLVKATREKATAEATLVERDRRGMGRASDVPQQNPHDLLIAAEGKARSLIEEATKAAEKLIADARSVRRKRKP